MDIVYFYCYLPLLTTKKGCNVLTDGVAGSWFSLCEVFPIVLVFCQYGTKLILSRSPHHSVFLSTDDTAACLHGIGHICELLGRVPRKLGSNKEKKIIHQFLTCVD